MTGAQLKLIVERSGYTKKKMAELLGFNDQRWRGLWFAQRQVRVY